jgi:hypothetical protein
MKQEFNSDDYQGRSEEHVKRNNFIFVLTTTIISFFALLIVLYFLFGEIL